MTIIQAVETLEGGCVCVRERERERETERGGRGVEMRMNYLQQTIK